MTPRQVAAALARRARVRARFRKAANEGMTGPELDALARTLTAADRHQRAHVLTVQARRAVAMASHPSVLGSHRHVRTLAPTFTAAARALHVADEVLCGGLDR